MSPNDADYCRHKGWTAGTVLHLLDGSYRITAVGKEAIWVRFLRTDGTRLAEVRWVRTLLDREVISAENRIRKLASALEADVDELLLLAQKIPADIRERVIGRYAESVRASWMSRRNGQHGAEGMTMKHAIEISEEGRQLVLLGLAVLSLDRPGFEYACRAAAAPFDNDNETFDAFRANADLYRPLSSGQNRRAEGRQADRETPP